MLKPLWFFVLVMFFLLSPVVMGLFLGDDILPYVTAGRPQSGPGEY